MLADELNADWNLVRTMEAPAHEEYANYAIAKGFLMGEAQVPSVLVDTVDGAFLSMMQAMNMQITGGSMSVRTTGRHAMRVAGAAAREMLSGAAAHEWGVPVAEVTTEASHVIHEGSGKREPFSRFAAAAAKRENGSRLPDPS